MMEKYLQNAIFVNLFFQIGFFGIFKVKNEIEGSKSWSGSINQMHVSHYPDPVMDSQHC